MRMSRYLTHLQYTNLGFASIFYHDKKCTISFAQIIEYQEMLPRAIEYEHPSVHCSRQTTLRLVSLYRNNSTFGDPWLTSVPARKCLHTIFLMAFLVVRMLPFLPRHTSLSCSYENLCWVCRVWSNLFPLLR